MVDEPVHQCARCLSTDIDCLHTNGHWHVCFTCGHDGPDTTPDAGAQITGGSNG